MNRELGERKPPPNQLFPRNSYSGKIPSKIRGFRSRSRWLSKFNGGLFLSIIHLL